MSEKLSALIDNELDELERARILKELGRDPDLAGLWSRYHIIGLAMRREEIAWGRDLPERVAQSLAQSLAPELGGAGDAGGAAKRRSVPRPASRLAMAASVAGVLLVGGLVVKLYQESGPGDGAVRAGQQVAFDNDATRWEGVDPRVEDSLNALLVEHGEFTSVSGMNGLTAYSKFVAYDSR